MYNNNAQKRVVDIDYFKEINTERKAYWLGFIMADGCVYKQNTTFRFQINLCEKDSGHLYKLNSDLGSNYNIVHKPYKQYFVAQLKINGKKFCENLISHGVIPRKSGKETLPKTLDKELIRHFIRGYFDGDGSVSLAKNKTAGEMSIISSSSLLDDFKKIVIELGGRFGEKAIRQHGPVFTISLANQTSLEKLYTYLYKDSTICLQRKRDVFEKIPYIQDICRSSEKLEEYDRKVSTVIT